MEAQSSRDGVRKLCSETAKGLSQREYLHSEYSRDELRGHKGDSQWVGVELRPELLHHSSGCNANDPESP